MTEQATQPLITVPSRLCPEGHRFATDLPDCPACVVIDQLQKNKGKLLGALKGIANHPHNSYHTESNSMYDIGVADGHRCAAQIAKAAIKEVTR